VRLRLGVVLYGLVGLIGGAVGGLILTIGIVVARARLEGAYFHDSDELISWIGLPLVIGPILGAWMGAAHPPGRSIVPGSAIGLTTGVALGWLLGGMIGEDPSGKWAGIAMGGALGLLLGVCVPLLRHFRRRRRALEEGWELGPRRPLFVALLVTALFLGPLVVLVLGAAAPEAPTEPHVEPMPDPSRVESVILLAGDAGLALEHTHPIVARLRAEVERWAELTESDSSVVVLLLGDNVYPLGLPEPGSLTWVQDSAKVAAQVSVVAGPRALERGARAIFLAGNHDWGERRDYEGAVRLGHLGNLLGKMSAAGPAVALLPPAGSGGPAVVDVGAQLRLVLLDTAWWLLEVESDPRGPVLQGVSDALGSAGGREVVIAAHHPFNSGGPHGGMAVLKKTLGVQALLSRSGALLQDLASRPYLELRRGLLEIFEEHGAPALFAGGHEHSMQLVGGGDSGLVPRRSLVSGSASKLTAVGPVPGLLIARSEPGFARLLVLRDGTLHLSIETAPAEYLVCPEDEAVRARCMADGVEAYRVVWSEALPRAN
jgi:hypothetical protein